MMLSNEERKRLILTSVWNGIGTAIGISIGGFLLTIFAKLIQLI